MASRDERIDILKRDRPNNCTTCWSRVHKGQTCPQKYCCTNSNCTDKNGQHAKLVCPTLLSSLSQPKTISQVAAHSVPNAVNITQPAPVSINIAGSDQKAVALPTAVMIAHNKAALKLPIEQRTVALMADSGGQRTLVSREAANRLGLEVIGRERACLQGYGARSGANNTFDVVNIKVGSHRKTSNLF